jgi:hypothetical protein
MGEKKAKTQDDIKAEYAKAKPRHVTIKGKTIQAQVRVTKMRPPAAPQPAPAPAPVQPPK